MSRTRDNLEAENFSFIRSMLGVRFLWFALVLQFGCFGIVVAQVSQPGGINQATNLRHWFKADSANCVVDQCAVGSVLAVVGPNPAAGGAGSLKYLSSKMSVNPSLNFSGKWLTFARNSNIDQNVTIFVVMKSSQNATNGTDWEQDPCVLGVDNTTGGNDRTLGLTFENGKIKYCEKASVNSALATLPSSGNYVDVPLLVVVARNADNTSNDQLSVNGTVAATFDVNNVQVNEYTDFVLGSQKGNGTRNFDGEIAEVIIYSTKLNNTDRAEVASYLAIRHGITVAFDYENLTTAGKVYELDGHFDSRIAGIARADASRLHQRLNRSASDTGLVVIHGMVTPAVAPGSYGPRFNAAPVTAMTNNTYEIIGSDNSSPTFNRNFGGGSANRLGRTFKVAETGTVGKVTLWFKSVTYNQLTAGQTYYLAYGSDSLIGIGENFIKMTSITGSNDYYVQVDFPANDTSYFTITKDSAFTGPAGVQRGLEFWMAADKRLKSGTTASITTLGDMSWNSHDLTLTGATRQWGPTNIQNNYHAVLQGGTLDRAWSTPAFRGRTIVAVGRASGGNTNNDGYMGFNGDKGLRRDGPSGALTIQGSGNTDDWTNAVANGLRRDGTAVGTASIAKFCIVLGEQDSLYRTRQFYLGGYFGTPARTFTTYDFSEVMVYDRVLSTPEKEILESYYAIKYGITLSHDYKSKDSTVVYAVGGGSLYNNDICGVGRDDKGALNQRQTKAETISSIVAFGLDQIKASDSLNTGSFGGNKHFLIAGHDNAAGSCWTTQEIKVPGEAGQHVRIQREWKVEVTGNNWSSGNIEFILDTANTTFPMPTLPKGSTTYNLYLSASSNFLTGPLTVFQMTRVSAGKYNVIVPQSAFTTGGSPNATYYMTFGAKLASSFDMITVCPSGVVKAFRSMIGPTDHCARLTLQKRTAPFNTFSFASDSVGVSKIAASGVCIDTLFFSLPPTVLSGSYNVGFDTVPGITGCFSAPYSGLAQPGSAPIALDSIKVVTGDVANFTYPGDTIYCVGENNAPANMGTSSPGTFQWVSGPVNTISSLVTDNITGTLLIHAGNVGTHRIKYVTNNPVCPATKFYEYTIKAMAPSSFAYAGSPYCGGDTANHTPSLTNGLVGGVFSSVPNLGVALNSTNGKPNIPAINPGNYVVTYTTPVGQCTLPSTATFTVNAATRCNFHYLDSNFCVGSGVIGPYVVNRPNTGFWQVASNSPGLPGAIHLTGSNGFIDLDSTAAGTYYIEYNVNAGGCTFNDRDTIYVHAPPVTTFTLSTFDTLCAGAPPVTALPTVAGGTFFSLDTTLTVSGVNISSAPGYVGGPYALYYTRTDPYCPDTTARYIYVKGSLPANIEYGQQSYCKNELDPLPQFLSGFSGGAFLSTPSGLIVNGSTGKIDLSASNAGTYTILYKVPDPTCPDTLNVDTIAIDTVRPATFNIGLDSICENLASPTFASFPADSNHFSVWSGGGPLANAIGAGPNLNSGLDPGGPYEVRNVRFSLTCSDTAYDYIKILRLDSAGIAFIPSIVCIGDFDPYPFNFGDGGGYYLSLIPGDTVDSLTGTVSIGAVTDTFIVSYTTVGSCPSTAIDSVIVTEEIDPAFNYPQNAYCTSDTGANTTPVVQSPGQGRFTVTPTGMVLDSVSGVINMLQTTQGVYNIRYTISQAGSCAGDHVQTITISEPDTVTTFDILPNTYCPSDSFAYPTLVGDTNGVYTASSGLLLANSDAGIISLINSQDTITRTYIVTYSLPGECQDTLQADVTILVMDDASFNYGAETSFCNGGPDVFPVAVDTSGIYTAFPPGILGLDSLTGQLFIQDSDTQGTITITHLTAGQCPNTSDVTVNVSYKPNNITLDADPGTTICVGQSVLVSASGGAQATFFYLNNSLTPVDTLNNDHLFSGIVDEDTIRVAFFTQGGCRVDSSIIIRANPIPTDSLISFPTTINANVDFVVQLMAFSNATHFHWTVDSISGDIDFSTLEDDTDPVDSAQIADITQLITLGGDFSPAEFTYIVTPIANGCVGEERRIKIKVNPNKVDVFIPQVITPDHNEKNDVWKIQWKDGINPALFTIKLYNEAGALVKTMNPLVSDWDGGDLPDGVYWYILFDDTQTMKEAAGLTIRRK